MTEWVALAGPTFRKHYELCEQLRVVAKAVMPGLQPAQAYMILAMPETDITIYGLAQIGVYHGSNPGYSVRTMTERGLLRLERGGQLDRNDQRLGNARMKFVRLTAKGRALRAELNRRLAPAAAELAAKAAA